MTWTHFMDMHSGGGTKEEPYEHIYIEAPEAEACVIFYNRFGHSPHCVSCTCCGNDYSVTEAESLEQATGYERGCASTNAGYIEEPRKGFGGFVYSHTPLDAYLERGDVLVIRASDIKPSERVGEVPEQGYVWRD